MNCNCRGGSVNCPMAGARCLDAKVKYQATVVCHKSNMRHSDQRICSSLAGYVWKLKDEGREFDVRWKILQQHTTFNPTNNSCRLCLSEKFTIMFQLEMATLNQRDEFYTPCMHKQNKLLDKT